ncbi:CGNR zinc finger domain-containing protein [Amycolatopsis umgeniensis]|uniref:Putative RNA-binding Zn ribbon-like protein n=1 Tax=Amycolatopsis umgeniensis TaxID=336628 RepID=A0A841B6N0_9PSEU|nr:CGNR zinc finger domain-containing protein [Amycolatopsis umgeniensis]MBB5856629.1 putative RNA-binding Zn ribbon-like protein [Amycolatopsis umgeniensis]
MASTQRDFLPGRSARAAAQRAVDLVVVLLGSEPSVSDVQVVLEAHGETSVELGPSDVASLREAALELREVFAARDVAEAAGTLNRLLAQYARPPRLTDHDAGFGWHLHIDDADDGPWAVWLVTSSALALAVLLADRQAPPGGLCAASGCGKPFAHLGGGSPRRYCSTRCATRERVAAHRQQRS